MFKLEFVQKSENLGQPKHGFNEMFERALTFLANPHKIWENGTYEARSNVLKLAFRGRIEYSRITELRTSEISLPFRVLGDIF